MMQARGPAGAKIRVKRGSSDLFLRAAPSRPMCGPVTLSGHHFIISVADKRFKMRNLQQRVLSRILTVFHGQLYALRSFSPQSYNENSASQNFSPKKIVESFSLDDLIHTILIRRSVAEYWFFATTVGCYAFGNCFCPSLALFYTM